MSNNNQQTTQNPSSLETYNILPKIDLLKYIGNHVKLNSDKGDTLKRKRDIDNHSNSNVNSIVNSNQTLDCKANVNTNKPNKYFRVQDKLIKHKYIVNTSDDESNTVIKSLETTEKIEKQSQKQLTLFSDKNSIWQDEFLANLETQKNTQKSSLNDTPKFNQSGSKINKFLDTSVISEQSHIRSKSNSIRESEDESFKKCSYKLFLNKNNLLLPRRKEVTGSQNVKNFLKPHSENNKVLNQIIGEIKNERETELKRSKSKIINSEYETSKIEFSRSNSVNLDSRKGINFDKEKMNKGSVNFNPTLINSINTLNVQNYSTSNSQITSNNTSYIQTINNNVDLNNSVSSLHHNQFNNTINNNNNNNQQHNNQHINNPQINPNNNSNNNMNPVNTMNTNFTETANQSVINNNNVINNSNQPIQQPIQQQPIQQQPLQQQTLQQPIQQQTLQQQTLQQQTLQQQTLQQQTLQQPMQPQTSNYSQSLTIPINTVVNNNGVEQSNIINSNQNIHSVSQVSNHSNISNHPISNSNTPTKINNNIVVNKNNYNYQNNNINVNSGENSNNINNLQHPTIVKPQNVNTGTIKADSVVSLSFYKRKRDNSNTSNASSVTTGLNNQQMHNNLMKTSAPVMNQSSPISNSNNNSNPQNKKRSLILKKK